MERLTEKYNGKNIVKSGHITFIYGTAGNRFEGEAIDKLAAYEDAEEHGRMIIFPCNKGDKLYEFYRECVEDRLEAGETPEDIINVRKVYGFEYEDDVLYIRASYHSNHSELCGGYGEDTPEFPVSEIGKTVFLHTSKPKPSLQKWEVRNEERRRYLLLKGSE